MEQKDNGSVSDESIWTEFAKSYDKVLRNWSLYEQLKDEAIKHMQCTKSILDQGCGTGIIALELAKQNKFVTGIDNNRHMLDIAYKCIKEIEEQNRPYQIPLLSVGDALDLKFNDLTFDGIVSNNVIFYVDDATKLIREAYRVLKPDGILVISGPRPDPDLNKLTEHITREFKEKGIYDDMKTHLDHFVSCSQKLKKTGMPNMYRAKEMAELLAKEGFTKILTARDDLYIGQSFLVAAQK